MKKKCVAGALAVTAPMALAPTALAAEVSSGVRVNYTALFQSVLSPLAGMTTALLGLATASGVVAIVAAVLRGVAFNSDSSNAATVSRVLRVVLMCGAVACSGSLILWVATSLGAPASPVSAVR